VWARVKKGKKKYRGNSMESVEEEVAAPLVNTPVEDMDHSSAEKKQKQNARWQWQEKKEMVSTIID
jgi:hypothetical protein